MGTTLTLAQLQTFVRLSELGTFARTAEELGLTPPAITLQVKSLSEHFGVPLIEVIKRRPTLTDAGRFLVQRSRAVLNDVETLEREMNEFTTARSGTLEIGATATISSYALAPLLVSFEGEHPEANIMVRVANGARLARYLEMRRINVALAIGPLDESIFDLIPFGEDRLVLIVPKQGHAFSKRRTVRADELSGETFIAREASSATRIIAERELAQRGVHMNTRLVVPSVEGISRAVEAGLGIAFLSWLVVERAVKDGRLHVVDVSDIDLRRQFTLATLKDRSLSPLAARFVEFVRASRIPQYKRRVRHSLAAT